MKKLFGLIAIMMLTSATNARASLLDSMVEFTQNTLSDDSRGLFIDNDTSGTVTVGDYLQGVISFAKLNGASTGDKLWAVYAYKVATIDNSGANPVISLTAEDNLMSTIITNAGFTNSLTITNDAAIVVVESSSSPSFGINDFDVTTASGGFINGGKVGGQLGGAAWSTKIIGNIESNKGDYHEITITSSTIPGNGGSTLNLAALLAGGNPAPALASYAAGYSIGDQNTRFAGFRDQTDSKGGGSQIITGATNSIRAINSSSSFETGDGWHFADDGDFLLTPVPEPSTIAIWAALGLGGCGLVARRRMKAKKS